MLAVVCMSSVALIVTLLIVRALAQENQQILVSSQPAFFSAQALDLALTSLDDTTADAVLVPKAASADVAAYRQAAADVDKKMADAEAHAGNAKQRQAYQQMRALLFGPNGYVPAMQHAVDSQLQGNHEKAVWLYNNSHYGPIENLLVKSEQDAQKTMDAAGAHVSSLERQAFIAGISLGAITALGGILLALVFSRSLSRRVRATAAAIENVVGKDFNALRSAFAELASGDLTASFSAQSEPVEASGNDEVAALSQNYNTLAGGLRTIAQSFDETVGRLRNAIHSVASAASHVGFVSSEVAISTDQSNVAVQEISRAVEELASGVARQAEHLRFTTGSLEGIGATVQRVAADAEAQQTSLSQAYGSRKNVQEQIDAISNFASELQSAATAARRDAAKGNDAMARTASAMESIRRQSGGAVSAISTLTERSHAITEIISIIGDIADQTNLLALNAAIEAARAGEHGRGFAVVATEVRKLAERSVTATREIEAILSAIRSEVEKAQQAMQSSAKATEEGLALAADSSDALRTLEAAIAQTDEIAVNVAHRAAAVREVSQNSTESERGVLAITERNAASAAEMKRAITDISAALNEIAQSAEEQSATAEQVSAAAIELAAQIQQLSGTANVLRGEGDTMTQVVAAFQVEGSEAKRLTP